VEPEVMPPNMPSILAKSQTVSYASSSFTEMSSFGQLSLALNWSLVILKVVQIVFAHLFCGAGSLRRF
jgi:hypothetical protein